MSALHEPRLISLALRMLRRLLKLYPATFRDRYAADMLLTFRDQCRDVYAREGAMGLIGLWLITSLNVSWEAGREHTHSVARLGALAWIVGGILWIIVHSPLPLGWLPVPMVALLMLLFGLACLLAQVAPYVGRWARLGFVLTGLGQIGILAGYGAAMLSHWEQTGVPMLTGTGLQSLGLSMLGLSLFEVQPTEPSRRRAAWQWVMLALAILNLIDAVWVFLPIRWEGLVYSPVWMLGVIVLAIIVGLCWVMLGVALWRGSEMQVGRIA